MKLLLVVVKSSGEKSLIVQADCARCFKPVELNGEDFHLTMRNGKMYLHHLECHDLEVRKT